MIDAASEAESVAGADEAEASAAGDAAVVAVSGVTQINTAMVVQALTPNPIHCQSK